VENNNKSFFWSQGIYIALLGLTGTLSLALMIMFKPNTSDAQIKNTNATTLAANTETQQRLEQLKAEMLNIWQREAQSKGVAPDVPSRFRGATIEEAKLSPDHKVIALTFDDGPWPKSTAQVLEILKKENVKGTFFVVGQNVKNYPDLTKSIVAEGHTIANHTWHHWYEPASSSL
jgi:peptidoglycan-N-acetylglucosamine deacetylase